MRLFNHKKQKTRRKELRNRSSPAEIILWHYLKNSRLGTKFRRQQGIGPYILDFYCSEHRLAIELDGQSHDYEQRFQYDAVRSGYIRSQGIIILRFANREVCSNLQGVVDEIVKYISPPRPAATPPQKGGDSPPPRPAATPPRKRGGE